MNTLNNVLSKLRTIQNDELDTKDVGDGCYMICLENESVFDEYVNSLTQNGFELYAENTVDKNKYSTYVSDGLVITAMHTPNNGKCKLLVQSVDTTELPTRESDNAYIPIDGLATTLTQVGCFYNSRTDEDGAVTNFGGMCYVVRLSDGSFIVVDGGQTAANADNLYSIMKKQSPDPDNIVIAAWVFSHDHGDHVGFFSQFCKQYSSKVTVEQFIYNFPSEEQCAADSNRDAVKKYIKAYFNDTKVVKAHPGQVFYIRDIKIDILFTLDIYEYDIYDTNLASLVFKLEFADGSTFLCLGDYGENGRTLLELYSRDTLKSDIVQVAHHGMGGQNETLYSVVAPEHAFFPIGAWHFKYKYNGRCIETHIDEREYNKWFFGGDNISRSNIHLAADDIW